MKLFLRTGIFILILIGVATGTYFITRHYVFKSAYNKGATAGHNQGYKDGYKHGNDIGYKNGTNDQKDKTSYQPFDYSAYNSGYKDGLAHNTPAASPSISCTSSTLGVTNPTTFTNCY